MQSFCEIRLDVAKSWDEFVGLLIPPLTILVIIGVVVFLAAKATRLKFPPGSVLFVSAFCLVGSVPGIVAGYSQQPIAGTFLTATIGIVSALLSLAFAKDSMEQWRPVIPLAMVVVLLGALAGFATGGVSKDKWLEFDQRRERSKFDFENLYVPVEKERRLKNLAVLAANDPKATVPIGDLAEANAPPRPAPPEDPCAPPPKKPSDKRSKPVRPTF